MARACLERAKSVRSRTNHRSFRHRGRCRVGLRASVAAIAVAAIVPAYAAKSSADAAPAAAAKPPVPANAPPQANAPAQKPSAPLQRFDIDDFAVQGADTLPQIEIEEAIYPFLGPNKTAEDVEKARAALEKAYHDKGFQTVSVAIPQQNVQGGVVALKVTELKVGRLRVKNSRYFDLDKVKNGAPSLKEGTVPEFRRCHQGHRVPQSMAGSSRHTGAACRRDAGHRRRRPRRRGQAAAACQPRGQQPAIAFHDGEPHRGHRALRQSVAARPFAELHLSGRAGTSERCRSVLRLVPRADQHRLAQCPGLRREVEQQRRDRWRHQRDRPRRDHRRARRDHAADPRGPVPHAVIRHRLQALRPDREARNRRLLVAGHLLSCGRNLRGDVPGSRSSRLSSTPASPTISGP